MTPTAYMTFWRRQNYAERKEISDCQELRDRED